jgi:radical SAM superfamily enzyme YgiQ (UPF0313 family)
MVNKNLDEAEILEAVGLLSASGLSSLKLYFMIGLPGEREGDLRGICDLVVKALSRLKGKKAPQVTVSVSYFTPKPHTALEDWPLLGELEMRGKGEFLKRMLGPVGGVDLKLEPPAQAIAQGLLSRGGPESFSLVEALRLMRGKCKAALKFIGHREFPREGFGPTIPRPWRIVAPRVGVGFLEREKENAEEGVLTPPCPKGTGCGRCGACGETPADG